jgi:hypothetical protein
VLPSATASAQVRVGGGTGVGVITPVGAAGSVGAAVAGADAVSVAATEVCTTSMGGAPGPPGRAQARSVASNKVRGIQCRRITIS